MEGNTQERKDVEGGFIEDIAASATEEVGPQNGCITIFSGGICCFIVLAVVGYKVWQTRGAVGRGATTVDKNAYDPPVDNSHNPAVDIPKNKHDQMELTAV